MAYSTAKHFGAAKYGGGVNVNGRTGEHDVRNQS